MPGPAAQLHILVTANTSAATRNLQQVDGQLRKTTASAQKTTSQFSTFAKGAATGFGIGAATVAVSKGVQTFVGFDKAMRNVNSIAQLSEKRFQSLSKRVLALAGPTAQAPQTLAEGLYQLVSSGFDANQSITILSKSARAATAGLTDTATATTAVAAVLNAYRLQAKDAGKVSDTLFQTVNLGVLTFEQLAQNIGDTLPFAATLKVSLAEVGASTATMTKQGLGAAETFTRIRNLLQTLIKPGKDLKAAYDELGVASGEQLIKQRGLQGALEALVGTTDGSKQAVAALFPNIRALGGALALTGGNARAAEKDLAGMRDTSGATSKALSQQAKSVAYQWQQLKAQISAATIEVGAHALPIIRETIKVLLAWDRILIKLPMLWIAVGTAAVQAGAAIVRAIRKPVGDTLSFILNRMGDLFALAGRLPFVGDKFDGLAEDAHKLAGQVDRWGEKTERSTKSTRNAVGPVNALKASVARLTGELNHMPSKKSVKVLVDIGFQGLEAGKNLLGGGGPGDGWGIGPAIDADVKARAKKAGPGGLLGAGVSGAFNLMGASPILAPFAALGTKFGLSVTSGLRPGAITNSGNVSYHASGHAIDVNKGTAAGMLAYARAMASLFGGRLKELIHTPLGFSIKNGQRVAPYAAADHYDHVHVAMQRGGMLPGKRPGDLNPAMLEDGEFVVNREATSRARPLLEAINRGIPRFQKGGPVGSSLLSGLDKVFPAHYLGQPGAQLSSDQVRAVAEQWGGLTPARALQADQITLGESSRHPGIIGQDPGGTLGIGLWQITRGVQGALGKSWIDSRGGDTGMRNPRKNAEVMSIMSGKGTSWSNWYGTRFLQPLQQNVQSVFGKGKVSIDPAESSKTRRKLSGLFTKLRGVQIPSLLGPSSKTLNQRIKGLTDLAAVAGEMASRAERIGGDVGGKSQTGWLNEQLGHLFALRNTLIDAEGLVERKRDAYTKAILQAQKRLEVIHDQIEKAAKERRQAVHELNQEKAKRKPNKAKVRDLQKRIGIIDAHQLARVAERKALGAAIPEFTKGRKELNTKRGDLLTTLVDVQGLGSPLVRLNALPAVGVLGGQILDVQLLLAEAAQRVTDSSTATTDSAVDNSGLLELLRQANLRTAVSQAQYDIFKNFDATSGAPFMGAFARGGVALVGEQGPELAHLPSGTRVHSASDTQQMLQPQLDVRVVVNGDVVNVPRGKQPVEVHTRDIRASNRAPLPGAGGGRR